MLVRCVRVWRNVMSCLVQAHCLTDSGVYRDIVNCYQWRIQDLQTGGKVERSRRECENFLTLDLKCRLLVHSERYFLQFSYLLYKQETLLLGLQNLLLQPACNAQHRDSKKRQTQAC